MATADGWGDLSDTELWQRLRRSGVSADQAAWVLNNRDEPEALAFIQRVAGER